ncbi:MAG: hypothetical protein ACOYB0_09685 [Polynucleobacter sp.]
MILQEALVGGTLYLDYLESELALPEKERVAFDYRALTNKEKVKLIHGAEGRFPNGADVCLVAVTAVHNLKGIVDNKKKGGAFDALKRIFDKEKIPDTVDLDTIEKILAYPDKDLTLAYVLEGIGTRIWFKQMGQEEELKNSQ